MAMSVSFSVVNGWSQSKYTRLPFITGSDRYIIVVDSFLAHKTLLDVSHHLLTRLMSPTVSMLTQWQECAGLSCTLNWYTVLFLISCVLLSDSYIPASYNNNNMLLWHIAMFTTQLPAAYQCSIEPGSIHWKGVLGAAASFMGAWRIETSTIGKVPRQPEFWSSVVYVNWMLKCLNKKWYYSQTTAAM